MSSNPNSKQGTPAPAAARGLELRDLLPGMPPVGTPSTAAPYGAGFGDGVTSPFGGSLGANANASSNYRAPLANNQSGAGGRAGGGFQAPPYDPMFGPQ